MRMGIAKEMGMIMSNASVKNLFEKLLSLQGSIVEVGVRDSGVQIQGLLAHVMFDSFLVHTETEKKIIAFDNILYIDKREKAA